MKCLWIDTVTRFILKIDIVTRLKKKVEKKSWNACCHFPPGTDRLILAKHKQYCLHCQKNVWDRWKSIENVAKPIHKIAFTMVNKSQAFVNNNNGIKSSTDMCLSMLSHSSLSVWTGEVVTCKIKRSAHAWFDRQSWSVVNVNGIQLTNKLGQYISTKTGIGRHWMIEYKYKNCILNSFGCILTTISLQLITCVKDLQDFTSQSCPTYWTLKIIIRSKFRKTWTVWSCKYIRSLKRNLEMSWTEVNIPSPILPPHFPSEYGRYCAFCKLKFVNRKYVVLVPCWPCESNQQLKVTQLCPNTCVTVYQNTCLRRNRSFCREMPTCQRGCASFIVWFQTPQLYCRSGRHTLSSKSIFSNTFQLTTTILAPLMNII